MVSFTLLRFKGLTIEDLVFACSLARSRLYILNVT